jgi:protein SCO1/2
MAELQRRLPAEVRLVSFTVDPQHDTPARLEAYARSAGADPNRWHFLTGPSDMVKYLLVQGFKVTMLEEAEKGEKNLVHDEHLVLLDGIGQIRGYYESESGAMKRLRSDAETLLRKP